MEVDEEKDSTVVIRQTPLINIMIQLVIIINKTSRCVEIFA